MSAVDTTAWQAFDGLADLYDCRPPYPSECVQAINRLLPAGLTGYVIEVGSGTGLFTGLLARELQPPGPILAVEPSADMRTAAARATAEQTNVTYIDATAERLPGEDESARLVVAAAAAQRFDRPRFYAEAARVLKPRGLLAFVQNSLDDSRSAFVRDYFTLLEKHSPEYRRGWRTARDGSYQPIDYLHELRNASQFSDAVAHEWPIVARVDQPRLAQLVRTSTILQPAVRRLGLKSVLDEALSLHERHAGRDGFVDMTYVNETYIARRK